MRSLRATGEIDGTDPYCYERKNINDIDGTPIPRRPVPVSILPYPGRHGTGAVPTAPEDGHPGPGGPIRRVGHEADAVG